jgi:hypothetical protein
MAIGLMTAQIRRRHTTTVEVVDAAEVATVEAGMGVQAEVDDGETNGR